MIIGDTYKDWLDGAEVSTFVVRDTHGNRYRLTENAPGVLTVQMVEPGDAQFASLSIRIEPVAGNSIKISPQPRSDLT